MNPSECKYLIVDGCFHDYLCAKRRKILTVGGVVRSYNLGCIGGCCPNLTPKGKTTIMIDYDLLTDISGLDGLNGSFPIFRGLYSPLLWYSDFVADIGIIYNSQSPFVNRLVYRGDINPN